MFAQSYFAWKCLSCKVMPFGFIHFSDHLFLYPLKSFFLKQHQKNRPLHFMLMQWP
jgi:hypothetical protein